MRRGSKSRPGSRPSLLSRLHFGSDLNAARQTALGKFVEESNSSSWSRAYTVNT
jgi:hypothetical protein